MQKLILSKSHTSHDLAHLYEHIFFIHADTILRDKSLFAPLDYSLDAHTTHGTVRIILELYNQSVNSKELFSSIQTLSIDFEHEITQLALTQLECEYACELPIVSTQNLYLRLTDFHNKTWLPSSQPEQPHPGHDEIVIVHGETIELTEARISLPLTIVTPELSPLLRQVAGLVINTYISDIADTYGGFVNSHTYQVNLNHEIEGVVLLRSSDNVQTKDIAPHLIETIDDISQNDGFSRLLTILQNTEIIEMPPSSERTFNDTGVRVTPEIWRNISTDKNLQSVLAALTSNVDITIE